MSASAFRTDVRRTRGLQAGQILLDRRTDSHQDEVHSLSEDEERLNKRIDEYVRTLESCLLDLVSMASVRDKSIVRTEQEAFSEEYRADQLVKATAGMAAMAKSLQLSLLLSIESGDSHSPNTKVEPQCESTRLREEIKRNKERCTVLCAEVFGLGPDQGGSPGAQGYA